MRRNPARLVVAQVRIKARSGGGIFTSEPYHADDFDAKETALSKLRSECMRQAIDFDDARSMKQIDIEVAQEPPSQPQSCGSGVLPHLENGEGYRAPSGPIRTSNLELVCVGNYAGRVTDTQCQVMVITEVIDHTKKSGLLYQTNLYVKSCRTIDNTHYCSYEIPDGVVCFYRRRIQTVPSVNEGRFFRMDDGVYTELGVGTEAIEHITCFLRDYVEQLHYKIGLVATPTNSV